MSIDETLEILRRAAPELKARYGVSGARVFGSVARGEADAFSDVDVAVRFEGGHPVDVMSLCGVSGLLSGLFGRTVDVVTLSPRDPALAAALERDGIGAF